QKKPEAGFGEKAESNVVLIQELRGNDLPIVLSAKRPGFLLRLATFAAADEVRIAGIFIRAKRPADRPYDVVAGRHQRRSRPADALRNASNAMNSKMMLAAASAVMLPVSNGSDTSTRSNPLKSIPVRPRRIANASRVEGPPTSGVPVPGAKAGSRKS